MTYKSPLLLVKSPLKHHSLGDPSEASSHPITSSNILRSSEMISHEIISPSYSNDIPNLGWYIMIIQISYIYIYIQLYIYILFGSYIQWYPKNHLPWVSITIQWYIMIYPSVSMVFICLNPSAWKISQICPCLLQNSSATAPRWRWGRRRSRSASLRHTWTTLSRPGRLLVLITDFYQM